MAERKMRALSRPGRSGAHASRDVPATRPGLRKGARPDGTARAAALSGVPFRVAVRRMSRRHAGPDRRTEAPGTHFANLRAPWRLPDAAHDRGRVAAVALSTLPYR